MLQGCFYRNGVGFLCYLIGHVKRLYIKLHVQLDIPFVVIHVRIILQDIAYIDGFRKVVFYLQEELMHPMHII